MSRLDFCNRLIWVSLIFPCWVFHCGILFRRRKLELELKRAQLEASVEREKELEAEVSF